MILAPRLVQDVADHRRRVGFAARPDDRDREVVDPLRQLDGDDRLGRRRERRLLDRVRVLVLEREVDPDPRIRVADDLRRDDDHEVDRGFRRVWLVRLLERGGSLIAATDGRGVGVAVMLVTNPPSAEPIPPTTMPRPPAPT